jgi:hypothetical protein
VLRIRDVYPGSRILIFNHSGSRISDPKTATKERGEKKLVVKPFFVATNFTKLNLLYFLNAEEKNWPVFKELQNFLPKNLSLSSKKYGVGIRDPEKNLFRIPDPGPGVKRHRIPDPDPQHCPPLRQFNRTQL